MSVRNVIIAAASIIGIIVVAAVIYYSNRADDRSGTIQESHRNQSAMAEDTARGNTKYGMDVDMDTADQSQNSTGTGTDTGDFGESDRARTFMPGLGEQPLKKSEKVDVSYNSPEYGLTLELCENGENRTFIRMQYYLNGATVENELDESDIPELSGIFENREKESGNGEAYRIKQALLNPAHSQIYLLIQGAPIGAFTQAYLYRVGLNDMSVKKLFSNPGLYGQMAFNKDFSLLAYSFGDPPAAGGHREDNMLEVLDCSSCDYIIKRNMCSDGSYIGTNSSAELLYDYEFTGWQSNSVLKLKQAVRPANDPRAGLTQIDVLYDISKNILLSPDGSELKQSTGRIPAGSEGGLFAGTGKGTSDAKGKTASDSNGEAFGNGSDQDTGNNSGSTDVPEKAAVSKPGGAGTGEKGTETGESRESRPVETLKSFYFCLGSPDNYNKAMQLLDDSFSLKLEMLEQFGVERLAKSDIDKENASLYSDILKTAKFVELTKEITNGDISTILYTQSLGADTGTQLRQPMKAVLKKVDGKWKITNIEDVMQ